jgi:hypothetical protein
MPLLANYHCCNTSFHSCMENDSIHAKNVFVLGSELVETVVETKG